MVKSAHGKVHGKTIQLVEDLGLSEGQEVEVQATVLLIQSRPGEGLQRCAGALAKAWTEEDDRILEEIHKDRRRDSRLEVLE